MFWTPDTQASGLPFNPFKSCCVPRPIGWVSTVSAAGVHNLAPYSQFQNLTWDPPTVMIAANCRSDGSLRDTAANILETGEFVWNMATFALREWVVASSREFEPDVDEFEALDIPYLPAARVRARRVAGSPVHMECKLTQHMEIPGNTPSSRAMLLVGQVVGMHIDDTALTSEGLIDITRLRPLARMGYRDYTDIREVYELSDLTGRDAASIPHLFESTAPRA